MVLIGLVPGIVLAACGGGQAEPAAPAPVAENTQPEISISDRAFSSFYICQGFVAGFVVSTVKSRT